MKRILAQISCYLFSFVIIMGGLGMLGIIALPGCDEKPATPTPQVYWEIKILSPNGEPVRTWETHERPSFVLNGTQVYWKTDEGLYVYTTAPTLIEEKRK